MVSLAKGGGKASDPSEGYGKNMAKAFKKIPMAAAAE